MDSNDPSSRFVSQDEVEAARERRDAQWKAAYARLGQEPPKQEESQAYDGRSLAEKLAANRAAKNEEWEERNKLANQFRALEEDEIMFLDSIREKEEAEERLRRETDGEEVKNFREAVAARSAATSPPVLPSSSASAPSKPTAAPVAKKDKNKSLKGVVVKKKKATTTPAKVDVKTDSAESAKDTQSTTKSELSKGSDAPEPQPKRRRIEES